MKKSQKLDIVNKMANGGKFLGNVYYSEPKADGEVDTLIVIDDHDQHVYVEILRDGNVSEEDFTYTDFVKFLRKDGFKFDHKDLGF